MKPGANGKTPDDQHQELVAAIYGAALAPFDYDKTVTLLDGLLYGNDDPLAEISAKLAQTAPRVSPHIDAVLKVQERIGRSRSVGDGLQIIIDAMPGPALVLAKGEQILKANAAALARFGAVPEKLATCIKDSEALKTIRAFLNAPTDETAENDMVATTGHDEKPTRMSIIVKRLSTELSAGAEGGLFLLSVIELGFNDQAVQLFRTAHNLTKAETEVAVLLAGGLRLNDIVEQRMVSADTVRTQIKTIKTKTEAADIPALVRLICGFSANVATPAFARPALPAAIDLGKPIKRMAQITLPDGRRMDYLEQGAANGKPVLLFHNVPYGMELPAAAILRAYDEKLRFIAPMRAGYGQSAILPDCHGDALVSQSADDYAALLDALKIKQVVALSHSGGTHFAQRLATRHPARVTALIAVGRAPIWRDAWMQAMPQQHRFVFRLTKLTPKLLPVVLWAMIACLDTSYAPQFIRNGCKECEPDTNAAQNPETVDLIVKGALAASRNTLEGFERECATSQLDLTEEARNCPHKFHILHGADDVIVPLVQSQTFVDEVPGTTLQIVENAGQLMFYSQWPKVMDAVVKAVKSQKI